MGSWEGFTTLIAGLLAVIFLACHVTIDQDRGDCRDHIALTMLSAAGLAASALFSIGLVYHLILQIWYALQIHG